MNTVATYLIQLRKTFFSHEIPIMWTFFSLFCCIQLVHGSFYRISFRRKTSSVCRDISTACHRYISQCKDSNIVKYQCKKTCGLCGTTTQRPTKTTTTGCIDRSELCPYIIDIDCNNNKNVRHSCEKTCGICACYDKASYCNVDDGVRKKLLCESPYGQENCPVLCNTCGKATTPILFTTRSRTPSTTQYTTRSITTTKTKPTTTTTTTTKLNTKKTIKPTAVSTTVKLTTNTKVACGLTFMIPGRIIGGITSKAGQWPWQAAILRDGIFICGGTLISPEWILTAAQCIDRISASSIKVVLGRLVRESSSDYKQIISTKQIITHPKYNHPKNLNNDIALIKLSKPAQLNQHVQVVCLLHQGEKTATNRKCYLTGWGKSSRSGNYMKKLHHASLSTVTNKDCQKLNSKYVPITDQMLCATGNKTSTISGCYGDTGGPFVCQEVDGHWKLHGIYSWGSPKCSSSDAYTVFTRASHFRNWIDQYV